MQLVPTPTRALSTLFAYKLVIHNPDIRRSGRAYDILATQRGAIQQAADFIREASRAWGTPPMAIDYVLRKVR